MGNHGFPSLTNNNEDLEEGFWSSFSNVMMVILKIFLLVIVLMALNNRNLLEDLKNSVQAQDAARQAAERANLEAQKAAEQAQQAFAQAQQATQQAKFQLQANATLEEQLEYLQQRAAALEMDLLRSRAETEEARNASASKDAELSHLRSLNREQGGTLALKEKAIVELQTNLNDRNAELAGLQAKVDESQKQLLSLRGEYTELDNKYQKLLRPARSAKGKQVVEVVYSKSGYSIRSPGEAALRSIGRPALDNELANLKARYGKELYVKVVIPDDSGLSYNEAWQFTNEMLTKYDYYNAP